MSDNRARSEGEGIALIKVSHVKASKNFEALLARVAHIEVAWSHSTRKEMDVNSENRYESISSARYTDRNAPSSRDRYPDPPGFTPIPPAPPPPAKSGPSNSRNEKFSIRMGPMTWTKYGRIKPLRLSITCALPHNGMVIDHDWPAEFQLDCMRQPQATKSSAGTSAEREERAALGSAENFGTEPEEMPEALTETHSNFEDRSAPMAVSDDIAVVEKEFAYVIFTTLKFSCNISDCQFIVLQD
ncbi:hypothetical protein C8J56DRAFT_891289 [Mycena floridula]|nr:hypothetical protein C8J56DRAFT_891289 [Mycena floridula]